MAVHLAAAGASASLGSENIGGTPSRGGVVLHWFNVDEFGLARAEAAQFAAYWSGIAFLAENLLPLVICRPPAVAPNIPAGYPCIGSGSNCNAVGHQAPSPFAKASVAFTRNWKRWPVSFVGIEPMRTKKRHTCGKRDRDSVRLARGKTAKRTRCCLVRRDFRLASSSFHRPLASCLASPVSGEAVSVANDD
jgi:hypothetical protein